MKLQEYIIEKEKNFNIQDYLSLGYVFLLVIGVFHEALYYGFVGVNILENSSILDVLLSPIALITGNIPIAIALVVMIIMIVFLLRWQPKYYNWLSNKEKYQTGKRKEKLDKAIKKIESTNYTLLILIYTFCTFIGLGVGRGLGAKSRINEEEIKLTHELVFIDGEHQKIRIMGKNSLNIFYVTNEDRMISISPIEGNVKRITKLKKDK